MKGLDAKYTFSQFFICFSLFPSAFVLVCKKNCTENLYLAFFRRDATFFSLPIPQFSTTFQPIQAHRFGKNWKIQQKNFPSTEFSLSICLCYVVFFFLHAEVQNQKLFCCCCFSIQIGKIRNIFLYSKMKSASSQHKIESINYRIPLFSVKSFSSIFTKHKCNFVWVLNAIVLSRCKIQGIFTFLRFFFSM